MNQDASLTIRLPAALKEALEEAAARDMRSVSQFCVIVLSKHLGLVDEWRDGRLRGAADKRAPGRRTKRARPPRS